MPQTLVMPPHSDVGDSVTVAIQSSGVVVFDSPSDRSMTPGRVGSRPRVWERGEVLGVMQCEVPFHAVIDPDLMTIQSSPAVVPWSFSGTGEGSQPFVAVFPSGAIRGVSAILRNGMVEFSLPMELIDPDLDPVFGMPFHFELIQFAPHPCDRVSTSSPAPEESQVSAQSE